MNDPLNDPVLQSLEARLAAQPPKLAERARSALLYECAFAAGQQAARVAARRWQAASCVLAIALVATALVPLRFHRSTIATGNRPAPVPAVAQADADRVPNVVVTSPQVALDAWQPNGNSGAQLAQALDRFRELDAHTRSLAVTSLADELALD